MSNKHPLKHEMKVCIEEMNVHINEVVSQIGGPPFLSAPTCGCISRPYLAPRSNQPPFFEANHRDHPLARGMRGVGTWRGKSRGPG